MTDGLRYMVLNQNATLYAPINVDLIVTSPPYALGKEYGARSDDDAVLTWRVTMINWLKMAFTHSFKGTRLAVNVPLDTTKNGLRPVYAHLVNMAAVAGWSYRFTIIWLEENISKKRARGSVMRASAPHVIAPCEMIAVFWKGSKGDWPLPDKSFTMEKDEWMGLTDGVWRVRGESRPYGGHPAAWPVEIPRRLIRLLSVPGALVCDPFCGSGTTGVAALQEERRFVGIDIEKKWCEVSKRRLEEVVASGGH